MKSIKLYLIPNLLGDTSTNVISKQAKDIIPTLSTFVVENLKIARRFLRKVDRTFDIDGSVFFELDKKTTIDQQIKFLNNAIANNKNIGIISDAGMPGIADPGEDFVLLAHNFGVEVIPLVGPSSILMALISSGLNAERFEFIGYLPIQRNDREKAIKQIEADSLRNEKSIIFMETPYRNNQLMESLINICNKDTMLSVACNITLPDQYIKTQSIKSWRRKTPGLHKKPTVFVLQR